MEAVDEGDEQYPVESRFAVRHTPPDEQDPRLDLVLQHKSVSSVLWYATPLPMNRIPFLPWPVEHKAGSSVLRYARPHFHQLFHPSRLAPDEHDDAFRSDPAGCFSGWTPSHVHEPWPYVCASRHSRLRLYVRMWPYFLSCTLAAVRTCTCYMHASTATRARLYIDQYVHTRSWPE